MKNALQQGLIFGTLIGLLREALPLNVAKNY